IEHWANGGETSLDNLILLCSAHHTLVHEGGFTLDKDYRDSWFFRRPAGPTAGRCHPAATGRRTSRTTTTASRASTSTASRRGGMSEVAAAQTTPAQEHSKSLEPRGRQTWGHPVSRQ